MAETFDIAVHRGTVEQAFRKLGSAAEKALVRSLNRTAAGAATAAVRAVSSNLRSTQKNVRRAITTKDARPERLESQVIARSKRIPIFDLRPSPSTPTAAKPKTGVSYLAATGRRRIPGSFIARMKSGHIGVFKRVKDAKRLPVAELFGPSIPLVFTRRDVQAAIKRVVSERLPRELKQNFAFFSRSI